MIKLLFLAALMSAGAFPDPTILDHPQAAKSRVPLSAEQHEIYTALLSRSDAAWAKFSEGDAIVINLVNQTTPLDLNLGDECLKGIDFENLTRARTLLHRFGTDLRLKKNVRLVEVTQEAAEMQAIREGRHGANLLKVSEIAFDKTHRHAVTSYVFLCGTLCGNAEAVVFEKIGQEWKETNRKCQGLVF